MGLFDQLKNAVGDLTASSDEALPSAAGAPEPLELDHELAAAAAALGFSTDGRLWKAGYQYSTLTLGEIACRVANHEHDRQLNREQRRSDRSLPAAVCGPSLWGTFRDRPVVCFEFTRGDLFNPQLGVTLTSDKWAKATCAVVTLPCRFPSLSLVPERFGLGSDTTVDRGGVSQSFSVRTARPDFASYFLSDPVVAAMSSTLDCLVEDTNWSYELADRYLLVTRAGGADWAQLNTVLTHLTMLLDAIDPRLASRSWEPDVQPGVGLDAYPDTYPPGHGPLIGLTQRALTGFAAAFDSSSASPLQALKMVGAMVRDQVETAKLDVDPATARAPGWYETAPGEITYYDGDFNVEESTCAIGDLWNVTPFEPPADFLWPGYYFADTTTKRWWDGRQWTELSFTPGKSHMGRRPEGFTPPPPARRR